MSSFPRCKVTSGKLVPDNSFVNQFRLGTVAADPGLLCDGVGCSKGKEVEMPISYGFAVVFYDAGEIIHLAINGQGVDDITSVVIVVNRSLERKGK